MFRISPYSRNNEAPYSTVKFMMFICMISFSMYRSLGSCLFDVWGLLQIFILHLDWKNVWYPHVYWPSGFFLYTVVVFLATCSVVLVIKRYLYTSVDVISDFFSYHVWLWWFLWWSGHLAISLRHMFSTFYCWVFHRTWFVCTFMIEWEAVVHRQIPSAKVFFLFVALVLLEFLIKWEQ